MYPSTRKYSINICQIDLKVAKSTRFCSYAGMGSQLVLFAYRL